jgi:hypothetical protein
MTDKCLKEKDAGPVVSTSKPYDRVHEYTGVSTKKVRQIRTTWETTGKIESTKSRRGKYKRHETSKRLWINVIRDRVVSLNLQGKPVTVNTIMEGSVLKNVMSHRTLRRALESMGFKYKSADKTQNFVESDYIKGCRRRYLIERMKIRNGDEDIIELWLDESYCHQHHVARQSWYREGDVVKRKGGGSGGRGRGRRWILVYAGGGDMLHDDWGWFGEPEIFQGKNGDNDDYHKNMNSDVFGKYFEGLCAWMQKEYPGREVVFHMDNAGYHKKIVGGGGRLSGAKKHEIITWLRSKNVPENLLYKSKDDKRYKTKAELYQLTKQEKYKGKSETETTAAKYGYRVLWIPPYHPMLNPIEEAWGIAKWYVARHNDGSNLYTVNTLIIDGFDRVTPDVWKKLVHRAYRTEDKMFKEFAGQEDEEDDDDDDDDDDDEEDDDNGGGDENDENDEEDEEEDDENNDGVSESSHDTIEEDWRELYVVVDQQDDEDDDDGGDGEEDDEDNNDEEEEDGGDGNEEGEEGDGEDDDDDEGDDDEEDEDDSDDSDYNDEENEENDDDDDYKYEKVTYDDMFHDSISHKKRSQVSLSRI